MSWGKVDDGWHDHPKVDKAGLEACGLWGIALSYCCDKLTDGVITRERVVKMAGSQAKATALAKKLCVAVLWHEANEPCPKGHDHCDRYRADEDGFRFHDWEDYQPTREETVRERERKRRNLETHRARKRNQKGPAPPPVTAAEAKMKPPLKPVSQPVTSGDEIAAPHVRARTPARDPVSRLPSPAEITTETSTPPFSAETPRAGGGVGFDEFREAVRAALRRHECFRVLDEVGTVEVLAMRAFDSKRTPQQAAEAIDHTGSKATMGGWSQSRIEGGLVWAVQSHRSSESAQRKLLAPLVDQSPSMNPAEDFNDTEEPS